MKTQENLHIPYDQKLQPYHKVVANLVCKHTKEGGSVLDIGCGVGHTLVEVKKIKPSLTLSAVDLDKNCLTLTRKRVELEYSITSTVEDLNLDKTFDAVIMSHILEHTYRPVDVVKQVMGLLKKDGIAVIAVPNPVRFYVILSNLLQRNYVNKGHVISWDRSHWINFLENILKLKVIEYSFDYIQLPGLKGSTFQTVGTWMSAVFPWFSFSNIAVVKNPNS